MRLVALRPPCMDLVAESIHWQPLGENSAFKPYVSTAACRRLEAGIQIEHKRKPALAFYC